MEVSPMKTSGLAICALMLLPAIGRGAPPSYEARVRADNPIGYWRLGEAPGATTAADISGNGNNGAYSGGITLGQPGFHDGDTAALFDGRSGRIVVRDSGTLSPQNISMEAKIGWAGPNEFQQRILEKSSPDGFQSHYGLSILNDGRVRVELRTGVGASTDPVCAARNLVCANSIAVVARTVETHIVATWDGKTIRIYLNGVLDSETGSGDRAGAIQRTSTDLAIGNQVSRDRPFNGV